MKKKNPIKGGQSIVEDVFRNYGVKQGPYITDDIKRNIELGKKKYLLNKYKNINEEAEIYNKIAKGEYNILQDTIDKKNDRLFKYKKLAYDTRIKIVNSASKIVGSILSGIGSFFKSLGTGVKNLGNIGKGVIIKTIVLLILIALLIGALVWFFKSNNPNNIFDYSNENTSMFFFKLDRPPSLFTDMFNQINNIIPDRYKVNFNIFKNNINRVIGNDLNGIKRETIDQGRYDGINHIKFENDDKIISIMKPRDIKWNVNFDNYPNIDYNKLPNDVKTKIYDKKEAFTLTATSTQLNNDTGSIFTYKMDDTKSPFQDITDEDDKSKIKPNVYQLRNDKNINENQYKYKKVSIDFVDDNNYDTYENIKKSYENSLKNKIKIK